MRDERGGMTQVRCDKNRVVIVTGAGRGLGRHIALRIANSGSLTALIGRSASELEKTASEIRRSGGRSLAVTCDIRRPDEVLRAVEQIRSELGAIDLLVNNAGVGGPIDTVWDVEPGAWWDAFETNVFGSFLFLNSVLPEMVERKNGTVVNIVSHAGVTRWPTCSAYSVSKCALIKLTENLAAETRKKNVKIFAFHPGLLSIGLSETETDVEYDQLSPAARVRDWYKAQLAAGNVVDIDTSLLALMKLIYGNYAELSGCYVAFDDDLDAMVAELRQTTAQTDRFRLRLNRS